MLQPLLSHSNRYLDICYANNIVMLTLRFMWNYSGKEVRLKLSQVNKLMTWTLSRRIVALTLSWKSHYLHYNSGCSSQAGLTLSVLISAIIAQNTLIVQTFNFYPSAISGRRVLSSSWRLSVCPSIRPSVRTWWRYPSSVHNISARLFKLHPLKHLGMD